MKLIDKFLKKLNTSRNTFATYILTLISIYITIDRLVEILFMIGKISFVKTSLKQHMRSDYALTNGTEDDGVYD